MWKVKSGWRVDVADLAPVEARMRDEDFDAGDEERDEGDEGEPVRDAHEQRMTRNNGAAR